MRGGVVETGLKVRRAEGGYHPRRAGGRHVTSEAGPGATVCRSPATRPHTPPLLAHPGRAPRTDKLSLSSTKALQNKRSLAKADSDSQPGNKVKQVYLPNSGESGQAEKRNALH
uniref:Uncharacterized protein n=1 Tax=Heliothis virescens TaxID=7102 RepID=A0A2A4KA68_HELVI